MDQATFVTFLLFLPKNWGAVRITGIRQKQIFFLDKLNQSIGYILVLCMCSGTFNLVVQTLSKQYVIWRTFINISYYEFETESCSSNTALSYNNLLVFHFNIMRAPPSCMLTIDMLVTKRSAVILHFCAWAPGTERHSLMFTVQHTSFCSPTGVQTWFSLMEVGQWAKQPNKMCLSCSLGSSDALDSFHINDTKY